MKLTFISSENNFIKSEIDFTKIVANPHKIVIPISNLYIDYE